MSKSLAYQDGYERGQNAAGWWTQENGGGRDTRGTQALTEWAQATLKAIDDGDCMVMDGIACPVNLSGEWAGDPTPETVADLYAKRPSPEHLDHLCTQWEDGAQQGWMDAIVEHLQNLAHAAV